MADTDSIGPAGWLSPRSTVSWTSRPTISSARSSSSVSEGMRLPTTFPRRMTVMRSAISSTSYSLWLMKMMLVPSAVSLRSTVKISLVSWGVSTAVGSSRTRMSAFRYSALRISTRCCHPTERLPTRRSGSISVPKKRPSSRMRVWAAVRSMNTGLAIGSSPSRMFSATVRTGTSMKCWWTMLIPCEMASEGEAMVTGFPPSRISPSSGVTRPYRMFISVVLPAPFSPRSAWISPRRTSRSMWSLATTPGKRLVTPRISSAAGRAVA